MAGVACIKVLLKNAAAVAAAAAAAATATVYLHMDTVEALAKCQEMPEWYAPALVSAICALAPHQNGITEMNTKREQQQNQIKQKNNKRKRSSLNYINISYKMRVNCRGCELDKPRAADKLSPWRCLLDGVHRSYSRLSSGISINQNAISKCYWCWH